MGEDYVKMWKNLGIDLENHDCLLKALAGFYQQIYLSQENRPEGMKYFDFVVSEAHGLRIKELLEAKKQGTLVKRIVSPYKISLQTFASIRIKQT